MLRIFTYHINNQHITQTPWNLPFYETGKIEKNPISEADVEIVLQLLRDVKPHQIYVAGDLADPHGTHRVCTDAVLAAIDIEKEAGA